MIAPVKAAKSSILDSSGRPFERFVPRPELAALMEQVANRRAANLHATYDAAQDTDEFRNYWANADALDADSANSRAVRSKLVPRSRYEVGNNGYVDGMVQTHANYVIGLGPSLRVQANNREFNAAVENPFAEWAKQIFLRRKLWCMAHAKVQDGEGLGITATNPRLNHRVKLDVLLIETEQCQTPMLPIDRAGYIDGIKFDDFCNPEWYDILPYHPGSNNYFPLGKVQSIPAEYVLHWFTLRRPGQHRGVPEFRSTLNVGAASRRFREATVAAAETAADLNVLLKTQQPPDDGPDAVAPFATMELYKRMQTALPMGWDAHQMRAEHPNATYDSFNRQQLNETARPKSIPFNLAACDSSGYNYASGRLDHQTYFAAVDVEREDAVDLVLDPLFKLFWREAVYVYGWNADPESPPPHSWDWPKHPVADIKSEATAIDSRLRNGSTTLRRVYSDAGLDYEDEVANMADDYGVTVDEMKAILRTAIFGNAAAPQPVEREEADSQ